MSAVASFFGAALIYAVFAALCAFLFWNGHAVAGWVALIGLLSLRISHSDKDDT